MLKQQIPINAPQSPLYRVFDPQVMSNAHDFDVRPTTHGDRRMLGVFAKRAIDMAECPVFVGVFAGYVRTEQEIEHKITRYMERHQVSRKTAIMRAACYNLTLVHYNVGCDLDPSDEEGALLPEFASCIANYVNEPPPDRAAKVTLVFNELRRRYELWLLDQVGQGEEIFTFYGFEYEREYPINMTACNEVQPRLIQQTSAFVLDERGAPAPVIITTIT